VNHIPKIHELEQAHGVTWGQLAGLEPRLDELLWKARADGASCRCGEDAERAFAPIRNALGELVGFRAGQSSHPVLGSLGAYEVAYWRLYDAVAGMLPSATPDIPFTGEEGAARPPSRRAARVREKVAALWDFVGLLSGAFSGRL
jgi:hypothetical protein